MAKLLAPTPFSPMVELDLSSVPAAAEPEHGPDLPLFMEDTAWPHPGRLDEYLERAGSLYVPTLARAAEHGFNVLELVAAFTPLFGAGDEREVVLWQRVGSARAAHAAADPRGAAEQHRGPGTWMHDALEVRDRWESRLLRRSAVVAARLERRPDGHRPPRPPRRRRARTRPRSSTATPSPPTPSSTPS